MTTDELKKLKTYKELSAKLTLESFDAAKTNIYLLMTTAGTILCRRKFEQDNSNISNILIANDVVFKTNSGVVIKIPELFIFTDEIVAFHPIHESEYQTIADSLSK